MEKLLDIGSGLKIARVQIDELKEQDLNARSMSPQMFERLTANIKNDNRLESLPFVAETDRGIEIVSGHHRVRAARSAGMNEIFVILDDTGLDRNKIRSKQLSHNSIQGEDNAQIVKEIYAMIDDAEDKLAAYIDKDMQEMLDKVKTNDVTFDADIKTILVNFLSYEEKTFTRCAEKLQTMYHELYVADIKNVEPFTQAIAKVGKEYDIKAMNTIFTKMAEIVLKDLGEEVESDEAVPVKDVMSATMIPAETAETITTTIQKAIKNKDCEEKNKWDFIRKLCEQYNEKA